VAAAQLVGLLKGALLMNSIFPLAAPTCQHSTAAFTQRIAQLFFHDFPVVDRFAPISGQSLPKTEAPKP
jgi:hypothetical protein